MKSSEYHNEPAAKLRQILAWLEQNGTEEGRAGMARYGITSTPAFGVSISALKTYAKGVGRDHALALALFDTGVYEARMLAAFVDDPTEVTSRQMDAWAATFDSWAVVDHVCFHLFDRAPDRWKKVPVWMKARSEFVKRAGFALLWSLALHDKNAPDEAFLRCLPLLEAGARDERHFVQKAVSMALRALERRSAPLRKAVQELAERLMVDDHKGARLIGKLALRDLGLTEHAIERTPKRMKPSDNKPAAKASAPKAPAAKASTAKASAPKASAKKASAKKASTPKASAKKASAPKASTKKASAPKASAPKAPAPKAPAKKASAPKASTAKASAPKASAPKASAPKAPTPKASAKTTRAAKTAKKTHVVGVGSSDEVAKFFATLDHPHVEALRELRRIILAADPTIAEGIKWKVPSFRTTEYFATLHLRAKKGVGVILHFGAKKRAAFTPREHIEDPSRLLEWIAEDRALVAFADLEGVKRRGAAFAALVREWIPHVES